MHSKLNLNVRYVVNDVEYVDFRFQTQFSRHQDIIKSVSLQYG